MAFVRNLTMGTLALLTVATAAGCGTSGLPTTGAPMAVQASLPTINAMGVVRQLGYDVTRYEKTKAKHDHAVHLVRQGALPASVDNRANCSPVADQGHLGSCTAFSMGKGLREFMANKNGENKAPLSALFLYYNERVLNGSVGQDSGATIDEGMASLTSTGIATEATDPYDITKFAAKPSAEAFTSAAEFKIHDSKQLATFDDVKTALANGQAVSFGFRVYQSFRNIGSDGMMPTPKPTEQVLGGHAVLAVGYDDAKQVLIVRNSWSATWGDKGYFYMPYAVASGSQAHQFFTATK